jgi:hypothetical protein
MYDLTQNFIMSPYPYIGLISLPRCKRRYRVEGIGRPSTSNFVQIFDFYVVSDHNLISFIGGYGFCLSMHDVIWTVIGGYRFKVLLVLFSLFPIYEGVGLLSVEGTFNFCGLIGLAGGGRSGGLGIVLGPRLVGEAKIDWYLVPVGPRLPVPTVSSLRYLTTIATRGSKYVCRILCWRLAFIRNILLLSPLTKSSWAACPQQSILPVNTKAAASRTSTTIIAQA